MADVNATAGAEQLAGDRGVDLSQVQGSGSGGKVTKEDVQAYLDNQESAQGGGQADAQAEPGVSSAATDGGLDDQPEDTEGEAQPDQASSQVFRVGLNPQRAVSSSIAVVLFVDGERREFKGGEYVTAEDYKALAAQKDSAGRQYLIKEGTVS